MRAKHPPEVASEDPGSREAEEKSALAQRSPWRSGFLGLAFCLLPVTGLWHQQAGGNIAPHSQAPLVDGSFLAHLCRLLLLTLSVLPILLLLEWDN